MMPKYSAFLIIAIVTSFRAIAQGHDRIDGWINVKEMGASGSAYESTASVMAGSGRITVLEPGDFKQGQEIILTKSNPRYLNPTLHGPGEPYATSRPLNDAVELRGYDGTGGSWLTYIIEIDNSDPLTFRWKQDLSKEWYGVKVPVTYDWQKLSGGTEIRFKKQEWVPGNMIDFSATDKMITTITNIEGNVFTLADTPQNTAEGAIISHSETSVLQKIIDSAIKKNKNIFFPAGRYRVPGGLKVVNAEVIRIEGENAETTVLDISDGNGSCFLLQEGTEVTIRNFSMTGHTGLSEAPLSFNTITGYGYWPNSLKGCNAVGMKGTERVLIENVHANRMSNEAFYAAGPARSGKNEPPRYQKSLTYLHCSVTDCAANAFNNNDRAENTSILYCRVDGAGWHAAEMPARFLRVIGSYFRNTGAITVGDMSHRYEDLNELGCGEAFICNNIFEGPSQCHGISINVGSQDIEGIGLCSGIAVSHGSSQVIISGNTFVNFNGNAIMVSSQTVRPALPWFSPDATQHWGSYPSRSVIISGNIIDMTCTGDSPVQRIGIKVSASEVTVANNQVYVRGKADPLVTGIHLSDPALKINVHDNLVSNCGGGLITSRCSSRVLQVIDKRTFRESSLPLEWRYTHQYQGWILNWIKDNKVSGTSVIDSYDPETLVFRLKDPYGMNYSDIFEVYSPGPANWNIHDNTITGCIKPVLLYNYGSETNSFCNNIIERGETTGVEAGITIDGRYRITDNHIIGFDEPGSCGLLLMPDRQGNSLPNIYRENLIMRCTMGIRESKPGLWKTATRERNSFTNCGTEVGKGIF